MAMKKSLYPIIFMLAVTTLCLETGALRIQEKKYVCLPCGQSCDATLHDKAGVCPVCNMELVEKETLKFKNIDFAQLCDRMKANKGIILLDVRSKEEFNNTSQTLNSFGRFRNAIYAKQPRGRGSVGTAQIHQMRIATGAVPINRKGDFSLFLARAPGIIRVRSQGLCGVYLND